MKIEVTKIKEGTVFYDIKLNLFHQVRRIEDSIFICSSAEYYSDAITSVSVSPYTSKYVFDNFLIITPEVIEKYTNYNKDGTMKVIGTDERFS